MSFSEMNMQITIDPGAGFCFGVEKAISVAESQLARGGAVFGLGEMVHNEHEISRLEALGLKTVSVEDFKRIGPAKVILRAHGEPPKTYEEAKKHGIEIIDATCSGVLHIEGQALTAYRGGYSDFETQRAQRIAEQRASARRARQPPEKSATGRSASPSPKPRPSSSCSARRRAL